MLEKFFVFRYLFAKSRASVVRIIAILSVSGVAVGVMAMVVVLSVMNGFDDAIRTRLLNVESHIRVHGATPDDATFDKISGVVGRRGNVERYSTQDIILRTLDGLYSGAVARGIEPGYIKSLSSKIQKLRVFENESSNDSSVELGPQEIAIGIDLAHSLGIFTGDEVNVIAPESLLLPVGELPIYERVRVKALLGTDVPAFDSQGVLFDREKGLPHLNDSASLDQGYEIRLLKLDDVPRIESQLRQRLQNPTADPQLKPGLKIDTWEQTNPGLFYSLRMEKLSMGIFLALTILVSCFSIVTVLVLLVTEKRMDVGVLRTMGARKKQVQRIFMTVGSVLGLFGIGGGLITGLLICFMLDKFPVIKLPKIYYDTSIPVSMDWGIIAAIAAIGALLTVAGTLVPAWRVAQLDPVDAIRRKDD